jgi:hypothetical protein
MPLFFFFNLAVVESDKNIMRFLSFLLFLLPFSLTAQTVCTIENREQLETTLEKLRQAELPKNDPNMLVLEIGQRFLGTPYVEKTLELPGEEQLVINLLGLDCTTYLETVISLARIAMLGELDFDSFADHLQNLRYRQGQGVSYPARLHYFTDWIYDNANKGILEDVTLQIGGQTYPNNPTFMSSNPKFYPQLADQANVEALMKTEKTISGRKYHFIPKDKIRQQEHLILPGDLIAITTSMENLDVVHVGFAIEVNDRIHLLHASSVSKQVEISAKPLSDYLAANKSQSGIMVSRLLMERRKERR